MKYDFTMDKNGTVKSAIWTDGSKDFCYGTNKSGEGVFKYFYNGNTSQLTGTCQFSIRGCTKENARCRIRKFMEN